MNEKRNFLPDDAPSDYQQIAADLRSLNDGVEPPEAFRTGWRAAVEKEAFRMKTTNLPRRPMRRARQALAVAAAAVFLIGGTALTRAFYPGAGGSPSTYADDSFADYATYQYADSRAPMLATNYSSAAKNSVVTLDEVASPDSVAAANDAAAQQRLVILRTASVSISSTNYDADLQRVLDAAEQVSGWSEYQSSENDGASRRRTSMTLRIPAASLDDFLDTLSQIGVVTNLETSTQDVSSNYYDTQSRMEIYIAQRERMTELLSQAEDMADIIEIENSLSDLQYRIESLQGSLKHWDSYAETSVVNLSLREIAVSEDKVEAGLFQRLGDAVKVSIRSAGEFFSDMLIFLVLALPYLAAVAAVTVLIALCARKRKARRRLQNSEQFERDHE